MTLEQIKAAVDAGKTVHWASTAYTVIHDTKNGCDQWLIAYCHGQRDANYIGLTWQDGVTMNGKPEQFFTVDPTDQDDNRAKSATEIVAARLAKWRKENPAIKITVRPDRAVVRIDGHVHARIYNGSRRDVLMKAKAYLKAIGYGIKTESEWLVEYDT